MNTFLKTIVREGREVSVQGLSPGYRGAAADVEQILLRWEVLRKEAVQAL